MIEKVSKHFSIKTFLGSIVGMFLLSIAFFGIAFVSQHAFEFLAPDGRVINYSGVDPTYADGYYEGEDIAFRSRNKRGLSVDAFREDTPRIMKDGLLFKGDTQRRPTTGTEHVPASSEYGKGNREYKLSIDPKATEAMMCGTIIAYTKLGYKKDVSYCTENFFPVNLEGER